MSDCVFCKIINNEIPSFKIYEDDHVLAFMDISPVADDHFLIIPKEHACKLHELSDESICHLMKAAKLIISKIGLENYNILQNNGAPAGQVVNHVHIHVLKRGCGEQLKVEWNEFKPNKSFDELKERSEILKKMVNE